MSYRHISVDPLLSKKIQTKLLRWFEEKGRDLPWRKTRDPYAIWVSEIMLQQTQVATVIPYYEKFLKSFPTLHHLAKASLSRVLKVWEGLGYYLRARNLHQASWLVLSRFDGRIPDTLEGLLCLPGIGRSTAGAILSFAFKKGAPILDGNAKRVLSRLFAISGDPKKTEGLLWKAAESLLPKGQAASFNHAIMDLGAMICTPRDPQCKVCPLDLYCKARDLGNPDRYPSQGVKKKVPHVVAVAAVIQKDGKVLLTQRAPKGFLGGLWEFPNWKNEEKGRLRLRSRLRNYIKKEMGMNVEVKGSLGTFKQAFTHFKLTLHVFNCKATAGREKGRWVPIRNLHLFPMSRLHRRIANSVSNFRLSISD